MLPNRATHHISLTWMYLVTYYKKTMTKIIRNANFTAWSENPPRKNPLSFSRQVKMKTQRCCKVDNKSILQTAGIHLFKVNNGNAKTICEICSNKNTSVDIFQTSFWCFYYWLWTGKCLLGTNINFGKIRRNR